jgi:hypothetical protein
MSRRISRRDLLAFAVFDSVFPFSLFRRKLSIAGIRFEVIRRGTDRRRFIWIHGNEPAARDVLRDHIRNTEGRAFLIESTDRNVVVKGGKLDPNRMFSGAGAERSLRTLNPNWSPQQIKSALDDLDDDRDEFLRRILPPAGELIVALHNNGPGYSVKDEVSISNGVAMNDAEHPDEFLLCSQESDFAILANSPFNALLQNRPQGEDDGSLSRLCAARGVRYVNIEAAQGNREGQKRILDWVEKTLP